MRENIGLFRGLDSSSERFKWVYGGLVLVSDPFTHDDVFNIVGETGKHTQVVPESVGECTGLKDSTGRLIFENDIVSIGGAVLEEALYVVFEDGAFILKSFAHEYYRAALRLVRNEQYHSRVIGFMHDGTELYEN